MQNSEAIFEVRRVADAFKNKFLVCCMFENKEYVYHFAYAFSAPAEKVKERMHEYWTVFSRVDINLAKAYLDSNFLPIPSSLKYNWIFLYRQSYDFSYIINIKLDRKPNYASALKIVKMRMRAAEDHFSSLATMKQYDTYVAHMRRLENKELKLITRSTSYC